MTAAFQPLGRRPLPPSAAQLAAALKRSAFLLNSARLVIEDPIARATAAEAVIDGECDRCHGDGRDPWNDYLLPCPVCGGRE